MDRELLLVRPAPALVELPPHLLVLAVQKTLFSVNVVRNVPSDALSFKTHTSVKQSLYDVPPPTPMYQPPEMVRPEKRKKPGKKTWGSFKIPKLSDRPVETRPASPVERPASPVERPASPVERPASPVEPRPVERRPPVERPVERRPPVERPVESPRRPSSPRRPVEMPVEMPMSPPVDIPVRPVPIRVAPDPTEASAFYPVVNSAFYQQPSPQFYQQPSPQFYQQPSPQFYQQPVFYQQPDAPPAFYPAYEPVSPQPAPSQPVPSQPAPSQPAPSQPPCDFLYDYYPTPSLEEESPWADLDKILSEQVFDEALLRELGRQIILNPVVLPKPVNVVNLDAPMWSYPQPPREQPIDLSIKSVM